MKRSRKPSKPTWLPSITNWVQLCLIVVAIYAIYGYVRFTNPGSSECITNSWCVDEWWLLAVLETSMWLLIIGATIVGWLISLLLIRFGLLLYVALLSLWGVPIMLTAIGYTHYGNDMSEFWGFIGLSIPFWILAIVLTIAYIQKTRR